MASTEHLGGNKHKIYVELGSDDQGKRIRRTKTVTVTSDLDLRRKAVAFESKCLNEDPEEWTQITFNKFVERWWQNHALENLAKGTQLNYEIILPHIQAYFGKMKLNKIKRYHLDEFFVKERADGRKSFSVKLTILQSIFGKAIEWDILTVNPTQRYKLKQKIVPKVVDTYTEEELELFFRILDNLNKRDRLLLLATSLGALRRGETLGIAEDVIDYDTNTIHIKRSLNWDSKGKRKYLGPPKGRKDRSIVYPEEFMKELRLFIFKQNETKFQYGEKWEYVDDVDLIFRTYGNVMHPHYFSELWKKTCESMGLRVINLHSLRHSSATYLHRQGMNIKALQEFLGHAKYETTANTYVHNEVEDLLLPSQKFTKFL